MNAPRAIALCQCFSGALEFQAGHWDMAEAALKDSINLYQELSAASGEALAWQRLGVVQTARGQVDEAMVSFNEGVVAAERATMRAHCLARLYASMTRNRLLANELKAAEQYLDLGLAMGRRHGNCSTCDALLLPAAVSVRLSQGAFEAAEEFCQQLEKAADEYGSRTWVVMARQTRGELAGALGEYEEALAYYTEAYEGFQATGYDYEAARCLEAIAQIRQKRTGAAEAEMARQARLEAEQIFERLTASKP
jgi:tetratricopeptide (TPR) repeat protein